MYEEFSLENCINVLESYTGKTSNLHKAEALLDQMCKKIIANEDNNKKALSFANSKELKEVENLLCKEFKAKQFVLHIYDDVVTNFMIGDNGFTKPQALASFRPDENGRSTCLNIYVSVGQGLIAKLKLTGGELMAIILHEIGHNVRKDWLRQFKDILFVGLDPVGALLSELGVFQAMYHVLPKSIEQTADSKILLIGKLVRKLKNFISDITKYPILVNNISILLKKPHLILKLIDPTTYVLSYVEEKYADSLATACGYGYETATVMSKFDDFSRASYGLKPSPIYIVEDFLIRTSSILLSPADVHPQSCVRLVSQIKNMKKHLNDPSITPEQRKELEKSLELTEKYINEIYKNPKSRKNLGAPFTYAWNMICISLNGYIDIREIFNVLRLEE